MVCICAGVSFSGSTNAASLKLHIVAQLIDPTLCSAPAAEYIASHASPYYSVLVAMTDLHKVIARLPLTALDAAIKSRQRSALNYWSPNVFETEHACTLSSGQVTTR